MRDSLTDNTASLHNGSALRARIGGVARIDITNLWWLGSWWRNTPPVASASPFSDGHSPAF